MMRNSFALFTTFLNGVVGTYQHLWLPSVVEDFTVKFDLKTEILSQNLRAAGHCC